MFPRLLQLALFGLVIGPFVGFFVGTLLTGVAMLAVGIADRLSPRELQEILPWMILLGVVFAALSLPVGVVSGAIFALAPRLETPAKVATASLVGFLTAALVLPQFLNFRSDGVALIAAIAIFVVSSAILGRAIAAFQNWRRRPAPLTAET